MSSKRGQKRKAARVCRAKVGHETVEAANWSRILTPSVGRLNVFKCKVCGKYHLGTPDRRRDQARRAAMP